MSAAGFLEGVLDETALYIVIIVRYHAVKLLEVANAKEDQIGCRSRGLAHHQQPGTSVDLYGTCLLPFSEHTTSRVDAALVLLKQ